jgi:hypothetical protein
LEKICQELENIISELIIIRNGPEYGFDVNAYEVHLFQERLVEIDSSRVNGKFLDVHGNISEGQAKVITLLEKAFDIVHDCVLMIQEPEHPQTIQEDVVELLKDASDSVWHFTKDSTEHLAVVSKNQAKYLTESIQEGAKKVREILRDPDSAVNTSISKLASVCRNGLTSLARFYYELEPVDEAMEPAKERLQLIRQTLYRMRNDFDEYFVKSKLDKDSSEVKERIAGFSKTVEDLHENLDEVDKLTSDAALAYDPMTSEVFMGHNHLRSLIDECYCLLYEVKDRLVAHQ